MKQSSVVCLLALAAGCLDDSLSRRICEPGAVECTGGGAGRICDYRGNRWVDTGCPVGQTCIDGGRCDEDGQNCVDACIDIICEPGQRSCDTNNVYVVECDGTGTNWCYLRDCAAPPVNGVCDEGRCVSVCSAGLKTYIGCEYYAADLDNANVPCGGGQMCNAGAAQFAVVASNPDSARVAHVVVSSGLIPHNPAVEGLCDPDRLLDPPDNFVAAAVIPPAGLEVLKLPKPADELAPGEDPLPRRDINGTVLAKLAYRVASNIPITAFQFNPLENEQVFSNDASLLMPTTAAGEDYFIMTREQVTPELRGYLTVVGIFDEPTSVDVTVTGRTLGGADIEPMMPGETRTFTLERFDVLNLESDAPGADLTGSIVHADKPVVVFGGHEAANAPTTSRCNEATRRCEWAERREREGNPLASEPTCGCTSADGPNCDPHANCRQYITCCADHLEMQLFPVSAWGSTYLAVRSYPRGPARLDLDVWRILAAQDDTVVTLDPPLATVPVLAAGGWFELEASVDFVINADKPILVGQFLVAEQAPAPDIQGGDAGTGDPAFTLAVPSRQFRKQYVFLAPDKYEHDYVSIAARPDTTVRIDGDSVYDVQKFPLAILTSFAEGWVSIRTPVTDGVHVLDCQVGCGVMVHGFDQYVSYAYPGGLDLVECGQDSDCPPARPRCVEFICTL